MSDSTKSVNDVIIKELWVSGAKNDDPNLQALHRHKERYVNRVLVNEPFKLYRSVRGIKGGYRLLNNKWCLLVDRCDKVHLHGNQNKRDDH
jgi:hypothetical protein